MATLRRYRTAMTGLVERHDGRTVSTWGDAVIAEFASVVEAVQCGVEIQQEVPNQDPGSPHAVSHRHQSRRRDGRRLRHYVDGVNIAARLQKFAEPGDVVVSGSVYDQAHNKLSLGFLDPTCAGGAQ